MNNVTPKKALVFRKLILPLDLQKCNVKYNNVPESQANYLVRDYRFLNFFPKLVLPGIEPEISTSSARITNRCVTVRLTFVIYHLFSCQ